LSISASGPRSQQPLWVELQRILIERIVGGEYAPGSALPTEAQLGAEYQVSRSVVREAIKVLTEKGLVRIDRGNGTLVTERADWRSFDPMVLAARLRGPDGLEVLRELFTLRRSVEPELAAMAARNADDEALVRLSLKVDELNRQLGSPDEYPAADLAFHDAIAEMSAIGLAQDFFKVISEPLIVSRTLTNRIPGGLEHAHRDHLDIFSRIRDRDEDGARAAMRRHICWAEEHLDEHAG
jgi:DNA-binding FadR family transcriptional regulator